MWSWTFRSIRRGGLRAALLTVGLLAVTMGGLLVAAASQTTLLTADRELHQYWRGSYDILVRPAGARSSIEEKHNLVEANHLSGIGGGINFDQYQIIKAIPGIEVAAPIAMVGYEPETVNVGGLGDLADPGAYVVSMTMTADPGTCLSDGPRLQQQIYYYVGPEAPSAGGLPTAGVYTNPPPWAVGATMGFPVLVAAIEPAQEAALVALDQAVTQGQYLTSDEPGFSRPFPKQPGSTGAPETLSLPALINATSYVSLTMHLELSGIALLPQASWSAIVASGGEEYLATLPTDAIASEQLDSGELYACLIQRLVRARLA